MASAPTSANSVPAHPASAPGRPVVRGLLATVLVLGAASSSAHDTWWPHLHCQDRRAFACVPEEEESGYDNPGNDDEEEEEEYEGGNPREREAAKPRVVSVTITSTPHQGDTYGLGEWIRVRVRFDKAIHVTGRPTLTLVWGAEASQVEQMWDSAEAVRAGEDSEAAGRTPDRFELDLGYGLGTHEGAGLLTTYGGFSIVGPGRRGYRLGGRIEMDESGI